jgi:hypothetical protein
MPQPTIPTLSFNIKGVDKFLAELEEGFEIQAGVASMGEAAAYSYVWEYGNARQVKEGPRTTKGINPDGEVVWLSIQAPTGYIAVSESQYHEILKDELSKVTFSGNASAIKKEFNGAVVRAMERIKEIIEDNAPVDEGDLSESFKVLKPGDSLLNSDDERILELGVE